MKKQLLLLAMILLPLVASAHDIEVKNADGVTIYYSFYNNGKELRVTYCGFYKNRYQGNVSIPEEVEYMGNTYKVTSIGQNAFSECTAVTSVVIGNNVKSIEYKAFQNCYGLTSINIGSSVTSINEVAFSGCSSLISIVVDSDNRIFDSRNNCNAIIIHL